MRQPIDIMHHFITLDGKLDEIGSKIANYTFIVTHQVTHSSFDFDATTSPIDHVLDNSTLKKQLLFHGSILSGRFSQYLAHTVYFNCGPGSMLW